MKNEKLKRCPFCGGLAKLHECYENFREYRYFIECTGCICTGSGEGYSSPHEAITAWNTRAYEETPRERFKREYREARLVAMAAPVNRWLEIIGSQCSDNSVKAFFDENYSCEKRPLWLRLTKYRSTKLWK